MPKMHSKNFFSNESIGSTGIYPLVVKLMESLYFFTAWSLDEFVNFVKANPLIFFEVIELQLNRWAVNI